MQRFDSNLAFVRSLRPASARPPVSDRQNMRIRRAQSIVDDDKPALVEFYLVISSPEIARCSPSTDRYQHATETLRLGPFRTDELGP